MRWKSRVFLVIFLVMSSHISRAAAFDWDPVTDVEKTMKSNPLDPGAVVLFKRGEVNVLEKTSLFWTTKLDLVLWDKRSMDIALERFRGQKAKS